MFPQFTEEGERKKKGEKMKKKRACSLLHFDHFTDKKIFGYQTGET